MELNPKKTDFEMSIDTRLLYERIKKMQIGDKVTYEELSALLGSDVTGRARGHLGAARRIAEREDQIVTEAIRKVGIKRLNDSETVASGNLFRRKIRSASRRGVRRVTSVEFDRLSDADKISHNVQLSVFGAVQSITEPRRVQRLEGAVNTSNTGQLPLGKTLELFK